MAKPADWRHYTRAEFTKLRRHNHWSLNAFNSGSSKPILRRNHEGVGLASRADFPLPRLASRLELTAHACKGWSSRDYIACVQGFQLVHLAECTFENQGQIRPLDCLFQVYPRYRNTCKLSEFYRRQRCDKWERQKQYLADKGHCS